MSASREARPRLARLGPTLRELPLLDHGCREVLRVLDMLAACPGLYTEHIPGLGSGVFTAKPIAAGTALVRDEDGTLRRRLLTLEEALARGYDRGQHLFQVSERFFLPPRGCFDDLFNHACVPTGGWMWTTQGARFIAIRDLQPGDPITYDYSTWMVTNDEILQCRCGSRECRGQVGAFHHLPAELQASYRRLRVVHPGALDPALQVPADSRVSALDFRAT